MVADLDRNKAGFQKFSFSKQSMKNQKLNEFFKNQPPASIKRREEIYGVSLFSILKKKTISEVT